MKQWIWHQLTNLEYSIVYIQCFIILLKCIYGGFAFLESPFIIIAWKTLHYLKCILLCYMEKNKIKRVWNDMRVQNSWHVLFLNSFYHLLQLQAGVIAQSHTNKQKHMCLPYNVTSFWLKKEMERERNPATQEKLALSLQTDIRNMRPALCQLNCLAVRGHGHIDTTRTNGHTLIHEHTHIWYYMKA